MYLHKKALYNLIQLDLISFKEKEVELEPWQKENYRSYTLEHLFGELRALDISYSQEGFEQLAKNFDTPEDLARSVDGQHPPLVQDRIYLLIFELWRRLFPEKQSLTLFCDELDHQIAFYERQERVPSKEIQDLLQQLQIILDKHVDEGLDPALAIPLVQHFCANQLEKFLYQYIADRIEENDLTYAKELIESFQRYMEDQIAIASLAACIEILENPEEGFKQLKNLFSTLNQHGSLELHLDLLAFLSKTGNHSLFSSLALQTLHLLKTEEDLRDLAHICYAHFTHIELETVAHKIKAIFTSIPLRFPSPSLHTDHPSYENLQAILRQKIPISTHNQ